MLVRVLLFGPEALALGRDSVEVDVPTGSRSEAVLASLGRAHPGLRPLLGNARLAVNSEFAGPDRAIHESDEVALIGLVSGG